MSPLPWMGLLDATIGVVDLLRSRRIRALRKAAGPEVDTAGVVAMTLREELERDRLRLQREREEREEAERQRAELAAKQERLRQAGDREIGRLRLVAGLAAVCWLGTLLLATLHGHVTGLGPRITLAVGWMLLLASIGASFAGQANVGKALESIASGDERALRRGVSSGIAGAIAVWLVVSGLAFAGLAILFS